MNTSDKHPAPGQEQPVLNILGEKVAFGPLRKDLLTLYQRWINDFDALRNLGDYTPKTMESETKWYEEWSTSKKVISFTVYALPEVEPIGSTSLMDIDHRNRTAEFGILIGEAGYRGKGYGTETTRLMLDYAFSSANLHNVMLTVFEFNAAGIRAYERAGFKEYGRRRQSHFANGKYWDIICMDCLSTEFEKSL